MNYIFHITRLFPADYDEMNAIVIVAKDAAVARMLAASKCGDEGEKTWVSSDNSSCDIIGTSHRDYHEPTIICRDFRAA